MTARADNRTAKGHLRRMALGPHNCTCPTRYSSTGRPHDLDCTHVVEQARWTAWLADQQARLDGDT